MMQDIELLAPAGNFEALKMAVYNGANAVYLGLDDFNARGNIENFNRDNLEQSVNFAHLFGVKIYLTINILVKDEEKDKFLKLVQFALEKNVDAFIIQDLGMAYILKKMFPNIVLHASTQMGCQSLEGVKFLEKLGFSRIVLARETPITEIIRIKQNSDIEIEYFIHGALCVAYSGNCYLCSLIANSSGNRGKCKQFCRLQYSLSDKNLKKEGYLLSTRDFCFLPRLKELCQSGVKSLKIEGRARRPSYVGQIVSIYRNALDNNFQFLTDDIQKAKKVFNRGDFFQGYDSNERVIYDKCQNHIGEEIGFVNCVNIGKKFNVFSIITKINLNKYDVLKFFENEKEMASLVIGDLKKIKNGYQITTTNFIKNNWKVRRIVDKNSEDDILNTKKFISVDIEFSAKENSNLLVKLKSQGVTTSFVSDFIAQKSVNQPLKNDDIISCFSKLGDYFKLNKINIELDNVFIRKSQLNEFRRQAISLLENKILEEYNIKNSINENKIKKSSEFMLINKSNNVKKMIFSSNLEKLKKFKNAENILVYNFDYLNINELYEFCLDYNKILYLNLPVINLYEEIETIKEALSKIDNLGIIANNYSHLQLTTINKTIIGSNLNVFNSSTVAYYASLGYKNLILSIEDIDYQKIKNSGVNLFAFSNFYPEYMYFKHCPVREHFVKDCKECKFNQNFSYKLNNIDFVLKRRKIKFCQFVLKSKLQKNIVLPNNINTIEEII